MEKDKSKLQAIYDLGVCDCTKKLDEINRSSGKEYEATASIGSAICDYNGEDTFKKLLKQADANMYRNKYERKKKHLL